MPGFNWRSVTARLALRRQGTPYAEAALKVIRIGEPFTVAFKLLVILTSYAVYPSNWRTAAFFLTLTAINVGTLFFSLRGRGPLQRGAWGIAFEMGITAAAIAAAGLFLPHRSALLVPYLLPLSNFGAAVQSLLALYPRPDIAGRPTATAILHSPALDLLPVVSVPPLSALAVVLNGYALSDLSADVLLMQLVWPAVGLLLGYAIWLMALEFAKSEATAVKRSYARLEKWMHSELLGDVAHMRRLSRYGNPTSLGAAIANLDQKIRAEQFELLRELDRVNVASVVARQIRRFKDSLHFQQVPRLGPWWEVPSETAWLLDRVMGDLLANAANSTATQVVLDVRQEDGFIRFELEDDGPGFDESMMATPGNSLACLRDDLRAGGGDLFLAAETSSRWLVARIRIA